MMHPGPATVVRRRRRLLRVALQGVSWNRDAAAERVRALAARALETPASRCGGQGWPVRALVDRAVRR